MQRVLAPASANLQSQTRATSTALVGSSWLNWPSAAAHTRSTRCLCSLQSFSSTNTSVRAPLPTLRSANLLTWNQSRQSLRCAAAATAPPETGEQTYEYQAEVDRLMDMIVNSLYSNKEIFLRELISNCSDALDKARIDALTNKSAASSEKLEIRVKADPDNKTIVIEDSGIGMTRQDLVDSLGTIARSGTARFAEALKESKGDANLIGRFGVGFYSSFLVADRVVVQTKHSDDKQWRWESTIGSSSYKIADDTEGEPLKRGTRVTLHLKDDAVPMASATKLGELIHQYSQFIQFPIALWTTRQESEQVVDEAKTATKQEEADKAAKEKGEDQAAPVDPEMKAESKDVWDWAVQNDSKPLWTRSPKEITKEEYDEFFKQTFSEFLEPLTYTHFNVEGTIEFSGMLFIPGMAPFQQDDFTRKPKSIKLFVRRVFIGDEFDESLLPRYLSFVKGVVDSSDLPLNVSREILQESRVVRAIQRQLVKRTLDLLASIAEDKSLPEGDQSGAAKPKYDIFYESFGKFLKLGLLEDKANKAQLSELVRFKSNQSGDSETSLKDYVSRMQDGQQGIFYIAADTATAAESSPFVEKLQSRGFEVLYLTDVIDEPALQSLEKYADKELIDVTREGLNLGEDEQDKQQVAEKEKALQPLTEFMKGVLGDKVAKVAVSSRLSDSPTALVTSKFGWSGQQERIMRNQMMADNRSAEYMRGQRTLEINPDHAIIQALSKDLPDNTMGAEAMTRLLYDAALITSGFTVDQPKEFGQRIYEIMEAVLGTEPSSHPSDAVTPDQVVEGGSNDPWKK
ncbi:hypothetical protein WJX73_008885 [Symbiochloris irregularis]|uniref:Histidine kinase/HSP90-like ATPase domain-containing protein n=1 Tax=Symbiochloris irregularis TaxID=706552 RepID=A0AAW1P7B8_9CHLO